eukprot:1184885-Prorocentrum_minimum.AAC.4
MTSPPFSATLAKTSSGTLRTSAARVCALECDHTTGARVALSTSCMAAGLACDRSSTTPSRLHSATTRRPKWVRPATPLAAGWGASEQALHHGKLAVCVRVKMRTPRRW